MLVLSQAALWAVGNPAVPIQKPRVSTTAEPNVQRTVCSPGQFLTDFMPFPQDYIRTDVDPGITPEGDFMGFSAFTRDGNQVLLTNRATNNVTVYDWATHSVITNVMVGSYPGGIACTDSFAVIALGFVDSVIVLRLSDYSIAARLPADTQPWVVRISPDQHTAYVACDISNTCDVYDLQSLSFVRSIPAFPIFLSTYSWNSENGRNAFTFSDFEVTPDGSHLILPADNDSIFFYNATSGACDDTVTGIGNCRFLAYSGDSSRFITCNEANPATAYQFDVVSHAITATVAITGYTLSTFETAVNMDGSKAYFGVSNNQSCLVRFATSDFVTFSNTYTAFWVGVSPDHTRAVSGQFNFSIVDFATEAVLGQASGNSQSCGAVSPVGNRCVGFDPHRNEGLYFYDYTTPGPGMYLANTVAGLDPEGDAPHRIAVTPDGTRAVCTNVLSDNASIVDLVSGTLDTIIPIADRPQEIAITSDSRWAVVTGGNSSLVKVLDLNDNSIAATVSVGSGPFTVSLSPDDSFAWVGCISSNTVDRILLDGTNSQEVAQIPVGEIGIIWGAYGMASATRASPDGRYVLVAVSFSDQVQVIDAETDAIVASVDVGDFPLDFAFNATGDYAIVSNALGNTISVLHVMGESTAVVTTVSRGQYPCRLAYNPVLDQIGVINLSSQNLVTLNPQTGALIGTASFASYGSPVQVEYDENGLPIVSVLGNSVPGYIIRDTQVIATPAIPCYLDYSGIGHRAAVASPGPDWVTILDWNPTRVSEKTVIRKDGLALRVPVIARRGSVPVTYCLPATGSAFLTVYDLTGARVAQINADGPALRGTLTWPAASLAAGVYFLRLEQNGRMARAKVLLTD